MQPWLYESSQTMSWRTSVGQPASACRCPKMRLSRARTAVPVPQTSTSPGSSSSGGSRSTPRAVPISRAMYPATANPPATTAPSSSAFWKKTRWRRSRSTNTSRSAPKRVQCRRSVFEAHPERPRQHEELVLAHPAVKGAARGAQRQHLAHTVDDVGPRVAAALLVVKDAPRQGGIEQSAPRRLGGVVLAGHRRHCRLCGERLRGVGVAVCLKACAHVTVIKEKTLRRIGRRRAPAAAPSAATCSRSTARRRRR